MPRFAVCYVPPSRSPFYRLGTGIIRYDLRAGRMLSENNPIRAQIPNFSERFVERPQGYGLHCTLVGPYECRQGDLPVIEAEITACLNMLDPGMPLLLVNHEEFVTFWGKERQIVALHYEPNISLVVLHTLLLARVLMLTGYGMASVVSGDDSLHERQRQQRFRYPHVLDGFHPHFTLLHPYTGSTHEHVGALLRGIFGGFKQHVCESICLMTQDRPGERWRIRREFFRQDFPQSLE